MAIAGRSAMGRSSQKTQEKIFISAYRLFYKQGFARTSVDAIAEDAKVTKRTLYNHFESKDALLAAVLDHQHQYAMAQVHSWGGSDPQTPEELVSSLFEKFEQWASTPRWHGSGFTRLTMELADLPGHPARKAASRHKAIVESWLSRELRKLGTKRPEQLARQIVLLLEGANSLMLIHGDSRYISLAGASASLLMRHRLA